MADDFLIAVITPPEIVEDEARKVTALLSSGAADAVHLRHPAASLQQMRAIVEAVPQQWHSRLRLHGHFALLDELNLAGPHLNSRCPQWNRTVVPGQSRWQPTVTRSCHSVDELADAARYDYVTLSPIYPSISKPGYGKHRDLAGLTPHLLGKRVVALGGVRPRNLHELQRAGFSGAALLGAVWEGDFWANLRRLRMLRPGRFSLQYITNGATPEDVAREVSLVLEGGCRWVQVRMKDADDAQVRRAVELVQPMCRQARAVLLIDDRVRLVRETGADGVHLGRDDMAPAEARRILGQMAIIGSTANNLDQVRALDFADIDYAGVGPLRFTATKKKLAPVLGFEGFDNIFGWMREHDCHLPVVAIGGITAADVAPLLKAGASGVAVSGAIGNAPDPVKAARAMKDEDFY